MVVAENCSSDWVVLLSSLLSSAARKRPRICPRGNPPPPPPPLNLMSKLDDDLLLEILIRLPNPRSSCRCKAVCKPWRSLLSDPSFNRRFISHHQSRNQPAALFLPSHDLQSILSFLPVPDKARPDLRAFGCCKDLLLCGFFAGVVYNADGSFHRRVYNTELERSFLLCNPFTKQWVALPLAPKRPIGYFQSQAGLVCQPRCSSSISSSNHNLVQQLGLGDEAEPEPAFVYSEYRFRVVCISQCRLNILLQVFCPESGKWTQMYLNQFVKNISINVVSWNGEFLWMHVDLSLASPRLAAYDPFRLDTTHNYMLLPPELRTPLSKGRANLSVSQGALHIIVVEVEGVRGFSRNALVVWRLERDTGYWSKQYEMTTSSSLWGDYELDKCSVVDLHPEKPEIVFLKYLDDCVFSCNLRTGTGEPEFFPAVTLDRYGPRWRVLQPRVSCWPTQIPGYEELRGMYNGSYDCWVQKRSARTTLPSTIARECRALVEQSGGRRKGKRSAAALHSMPCGRRKQKVGVI